MFNVSFTLDLEAVYMIVFALEYDVVDMLILQDNGTCAKFFL